MPRRELLITGGVIVLGLLMAFPLTVLFGPGASLRQSASRSGRRDYAVHQTDGEGNDWAITPIGNRATRTSPDGEQAKPAIVVKTDIFRQSPRTVLIGLVLTDHNGQRYHPAVTKNTKRRPVPTLEIVDEAGKVLDDGIFRYG